MKTAEGKANVLQEGSPSTSCARLGHLRPPPKFGPPPVSRSGFDGQGLLVFSLPDDLIQILIRKPVSSIQRASKIIKMKKNHTGDEKSVPCTERVCSPHHERAVHKSHINRGTQIPKIKSKTRSKLDSSSSNSHRTLKQTKNHISRSEWFSLVGVHGMKLSSYGPFWTSFTGRLRVWTV